MSFRLSMRPLAAALAIAFVLAGCDSADGTDSSATADTEDAALTVASALALDGGGVLEDAAASAAVAAPEAANRAADGYPAFPSRPGCRPTRTFDEASFLYTIASDCERTSGGGLFSASFQRVATARFFSSDGQPQAERAGATMLHYDLLSGSSAFVTPHGSHHLLHLTGEFTVTDLDQNLVTINGTYSRAATDTLSGVRGERTYTHELALTLTDVRGPRGVVDNWRRAVSGSLSGTYHATRTATGSGGATSSREITRTVQITLPAGGSDVAEIAVDGRTFHADRRTGEVQEID